VRAGKLLRHLGSRFRELRRDGCKTRRDSQQIFHAVAHFAREQFAAFLGLLG
jgi:hypothetical protein